jgi:DNA-directed RNA polymerase omega subunit
MSKISSRGPDVDTDKCVEQAGGNRFNLVLIAAQRAREIRRRQQDSNPEVHSLPCVSALLEIQEGKLDNKRYLMKVK